MNSIEAFEPSLAQPGLAYRHFINALDSLRVGYDGIEVFREKLPTSALLVRYEDVVFLVKAPLVI